MQPRQTFAYVPEKGFNADTRTLRAVISTPNKDRHGEVVLPSAFEKNLDHFLANPVVLAGHQHRLEDGGVPVIGMVLALDITEGAVEADIRFAPGDVNPLGPQYERAYELGFMRAFSVGFIPIEIRAEEGEPLTHTEIELIELSACSVPSNRQSLSAEGKDAGLVALAERTAATPEDPAKRLKPHRRIRPGRAGGRSPRGSSPRRTSARPPSCRRGPSSDHSARRRRT